MPFAHEHSARLVDPRRFKEFARANDRGGKGVAFVFGIKNDSSFIQAIRFDKNLFTVAEAKAWLERNHFKPIKFEPARESVRKNPNDELPKPGDRYTAEIALSAMFSKHPKTQLQKEAIKKLKSKYPAFYEKMKLKAESQGYFDNPAMRKNPQMTEAQYRKILVKMLEDEQEGIKAYKKFILSLPVNPEADKVRRILSEILADEERHEKLLLRLAVF